MMDMPEAAVHKNDLLSARKHDVRLAVKVGSVDLVPNAHRIQHRANSDFGAGKQDSTLAPWARQKLAQRVSVGYVVYKDI
jgi:hypothetical protein